MLEARFPRRLFAGVAHSAKPLALVTNGVPGHVLIVT